MMSKMLPIAQSEIDLGASALIPTIPPVMMLNIIEPKAICRWDL